MKVLRQKVILARLTLPIRVNTISVHLLRVVRIFNNMTIARF